VSKAHEQPLLTKEAAQAAIVESLGSDTSVVAAFLFGSLASGRAGPLSDVDVGLLLRDPRDSERVCGRTMDELCRRLKTSRVQVVSLAGMPPPVRYRVIRDGVLVVSRDAAVVERFVADTVRHYLDFQPLRDRAFETMRSAILSGAGGR
jgi:predicted nucleotidyltransferase